MLTVRVLPRRGVTLRAAVATVEVTGALSLGHLLAGGSLPSVPWLAVMAAVVLGSGLLVLHGRVRPRVAVPLLVGAQLLLHAWLMALTAGTDQMGHAMADSMANSTGGGHAHALLDPSMIAVHVAGGLLTALLWELRARVAEVVVTWTTQPLPPLPSLRTVRAAAVDPLRLVTRSVVSVAPRRGPPRAVVVTA